MARLCPLFSGSSGNSYYIGSRSEGILIDAGRSARQLDGMLKICNIDPLAIQAVFVTHEHTDHVNGVRVFTKKYGIPVYASPGTLRAIAPQSQGTRLLPIEGPVEAGGMTVEPFPISHDCAQPTGYRVHTADGRDFCLATDLGYLSEEVKDRLSGCGLVVVESNHDVEMLREGPYPYHLKRRILSREGHLSNADCSAFLPELVRRGTRRFILAHLSRENNTPALALESARRALAQEGFVEDVDFTLETAPVENSSGRTVVF